MADKPLFSEEKYQELVRNLNRREINLAAVWRNFAKLGVRESYGRLFFLLDSPDLEKHQVINALQVLIELRHVTDLTKAPLGDPDALFKKILQLSSDPRIQVRSAAIGLAVEFTTVFAHDKHQRFESATREIVEPIARRAMEMGLVNPYALVVKEFLGS